MGSSVVLSWDKKLCQILFVSHPFFILQSKNFEHKNCASTVLLNSVVADNLSLHLACENMGKRGFDKNVQKLSKQERSD